MGDGGIVMAIKTTYVCKSFLADPKRLGKGEWRVLGFVYADSTSEAWDKALAQWRGVDSVYPLDYVD